ncbi:lipopolysaccharide biosynthesis protein [Nocardioides houyundeii]|uniref:lipopolysaccharide biosynthesis protein n=1 Tax=Nocardioides houyundeii TaxID=2045452 RepID=UPI003B837956
MQMRDKLGNLMRTGAGIAVAMGVMNVATYGYTMIAAKMLGPQAYGRFIATMAVLLVVSVVSLGLQTTAARRISADPAHVGQIQADILRFTLRASLILGAVLLVLSPVVNAVLKLDNLMMAALIGPAAVPLTMMGGQAGTLQGERKWLPLGVLYISAGVPRLLVGTAMLLWEPNELVAFLAVILGSVAPVVVGWWALRPVREPEVSTELPQGREIAKEIFHNSQALFAFFALSNVDIVVARNVLSEHDAGLYAGGLILAKAMLFLPQFVVVVAFPAMASAHERRRALGRSLALVSALGLVGTGTVALLSSLAMVFVGGEDFAEIQGRLWLFAILGTAMSMLQLVVYSVIARQGQRSVYLVWAALAAVVLGGLMVGSITSLLVWVVLVDLALLVALLAISFLLVPDDALPEPQDVSQHPV